MMFFYVSGDSNSQTISLAFYQSARAFKVIEYLQFKHYLYSGICYWGDAGRCCNGRSRRTRGVDLLCCVADQFSDYVYPGRSQRF